MRIRSAHSVSMRYAICAVVCWSCLVSAVGGCGASTQKDGASAARYSKKVTLECLQHEGFKVTGRSITSGPVGAAPNEVLAALRRCGVMIEGTQSGGDVNRAIIRRELLRNVRCIREHGFMVTAGHDIELELYNAHGVDTSKPAFRTAVAVCRKRFAQAVEKLSPGSVPVVPEGESVDKQLTVASSASRCISRMGAEPVEAGRMLGIKVLAEGSRQRFHGFCKLSIGVCLECNYLLGVYIR